MQLFLSHASEQKDLARYVYQALLQEGHDVFLDESELRAGEGYHAGIRQEVQRCDGFVFLISPASLAPGCYTLTELGYAKRKWKDPTGRVLPVVVEPVDMEGVDPYLRTVSILTPKGNVAAEIAAAVAEWGTSEDADTGVEAAADLSFYLKCTARKHAGQAGELRLRIGLSAGAMLIGLSVIAFAQLRVDSGELELILSAGGGALTGLGAIPATGIMPARARLRALEVLRVGFESISPEMAAAGSERMSRLVDTFYKLLDADLATG